MKVNFKKYFAILLMFFSIMIGSASWIIVGEKNIVVGESPVNTAVCYFISKGGNINEFTRVEKALEYASNYINDTEKEDSSIDVIVIPGTNPIISKDCKITTGVSLILPYTLSSDYSSFETLNESGTNKDFADATPTAINNNLKNNIIIDGAKLEIQAGGSLTIGGVLADTDANLAGHTSGYYSQITMKNNSKIISNGNIYCYGYIKEDYLSKNTCLVEIINGQVVQPFVVYDFRGGTNTAIVYRKGNISPFNIFDMPNIQAEFKIHSNAVLTGKANLYANDSYNRTDIKIISNSSSIITLNTSSYVICKYTPKWVVENDVYYATTTIDSNQSSSTLDASNGYNYCRTSLKIYGDASTGAMTMNISNVDVSTADVLFPISWKLDVEIYDGEFILNNKYKVMTGASVYIHDSATFTIGSSSEMIIYSEFEDVAFKNCYAYPVKSSGRFVNDGVLNILGTFGGFIESVNDDGMLSIDSGATLSIESLEGNSGDSSAIDALLNTGTFNIVDTLNESAIGYIGTQTESQFSTNFYMSTNKVWNINSDTYTVNYYSIIDNGEPVKTSSTTATLKDGITLSDPTGSTGTFVGWYYDKLFENEVLNNKVLGTQLYNYSSNKVLNLYSRWTTGSTVNVIYYDTYSSSSYPTSGTTLNKMADQYITVNKGLDSYTVLESSDTKMTIYTFEKWQVYYNGELINDSLIPGSSYRIPSDITSGDLLIKPYYSSISYYKITISSASSIIDYTDALTISGQTIISDSNWALSGTKITVNLTSNNKYQLRYCSISGSTFGDNSTKLSCTSSSLSIESYFIVNNSGVTLTVGRG